MKNIGKTVGLINRAIHMDGTEAQTMVQKIRDNEGYNNEAKVGELYVQMLRDGGDVSAVLEGSEVAQQPAKVDNSPNGEYNGEKSNFGMVNNSYTEDTNTEQETVLYSGAISGAYNDRNDPDATKRNEHATRYYQELRNSNKDAFITAVAKHTNLDANLVSKAYKHIFEDRHHLEGGYIYFEPDYDMAETFRRLRTNDQIQNHDIILLYHEALEYDLMQENPHMTYEEAHEIAQQRYNYKAALMEWLRKRGE